MNQAQSYFLRGNVAHLHDRTKKTLQRSSWPKDAVENACWININEGELELNLKAKITGSTNTKLVAGLSTGETGKVKVEDAIAKVVSGDSEATLTKDGKLTLTTKMPSLKGETFNVECGIDKETKLPYVGASIAYEFYEYKMNTAIGECTLTGTCTFKNTFKPELENNMCHLYVPAYRLAEKALPIVQGAAIAGGLLIAAPTAGATVGGALISGGKLLPVLAVAGGGLISSSVFAGSHNLKSNKLKVPSLDGTITAHFEGFSISEAGS